MSQNTSNTGSGINVAQRNTNNTNETINISSIADTDRIRKQYGDISGLANSIRRYGIIQPVVIQRDGAGSGCHLLVAGGRRLAALRQIGKTVLSHSVEFVWREENVSNPSTALRLQAMELEENVRRSDLTWPEEIAAKLKLLRTMQSIHGVSRGFGAGKTSVADSGFGIRTLAEMLGENPSTTSRDIDLAQYVEKHTILATMPTKADALRKLGVAVTIAAMQTLAKRSTVSGVQVASSNAETGAVEVGDKSDSLPKSLGRQGGNSEASPAAISGERWILYEGSFQENISIVSSRSVDLVLTDLPYNIGLGNSTAYHGAGLGQFFDESFDIVGLCSDVAIEAYRVLRQDRFAVFFYGMNYHGVLYDALTTAGFEVDPYPVIWVRDRTAPPDGFARYSKSFDPALIARKGNARFVRPNLPNVIQIPSVRGPERLHSAQKPIEVMEKFILDMTTTDCVVLDMFSGAGTTGVAAIRLNRKAILFELEKQNCLIAESRLKTTKLGSGLR